MEEIFKYLGDADLNIGLHVLAPKPLDDRSVVKRTSQLYKIPENRAYEGMTVANLENNNIYMLIDKNKIGYREGWKASYESIQIVTCTYDQYKIWEENTNDDFTPKDEALEFLHEDTYYYIYEDSLPNDIADQEYVKASQFRELQDVVATKANTTSLQPIRESITNVQSNVETSINDIRNSVETSINEVKDDIEQNYATISYTEETYVPLSWIKGNEEEGLSGLLGNYYTKDESDEKYVTISSLKGEGLGEGSYIFVTSSEYSTDKTNLDTRLTGIETDLSNTLKVGEAGELGDIVASSYTFKDGYKLSQTEDNKLMFGDNEIAMVSDIPEHVTLTKQEYDALVESGELNEDTYYHILEDEDLHDTYILKSYLDANYDNKNTYQVYVASKYLKLSDFGEFKSDLEIKLEEFQKAGDFVTNSELETKIASYYTKTEADETFVKNADLETKFGSYYTSTQVDDTFVKNNDLTTTLSNYVTIAMLGGEEGADGDYMFLTKAEWETYLSTTLAGQLSSKADLGEDVEFSSVKTDLIGNDDSVIQFTENGVSVGKKDEEVFPVALQKDIPVIEVMEQQEYENAEKNEDHFYFIYKEDGMGFVSVEVFNQLVSTVNGLQQTIGRLNQRITDLETRLNSTSPEEP